MLRRCFFGFLFSRFHLCSFVLVHEARRGVRKGVWLENGDEKERGLIDMCLVETSKERVVGATKGLGGDGFSGVQGNHTEWCWYSKNGLILSELQEVSGTKWLQMDILAGV